MDLPDPHGGSLTPCLVSGDKADEISRHAARHKQLSISTQTASDVLMLATGAFSPLEGFMMEADYQSVVEKMRLLSGLVWPIPITLPVGKQEAASFDVGEFVYLYPSDTGAPIARVSVEQIYTYDKKREATSVFGTADLAHPGVRKLFDQGDRYVAGRVEVLTESGFRNRFSEYAGPAEVRNSIQQLGWSKVAAFQTRNPMHRSHEYLAKIALEVCDGLLLHPVVGKLKEGDIPADVRMECYGALLNSYFPPERVLLRVYPMEMRYAGPREALLHAIIRQNFGCSYLIVGRDHAGVGTFYDPFAAQQIFDSLTPEDLSIRPLKLDWTFWCRACDAMASMKTCPHTAEDRLLISGTRLREMLASGATPPEHFSRPEVIEILVRYYEGAGRQ